MSGRRWAPRGRGRTARARADLAGGGWVGRLPSAGLFQGRRERAAARWPWSSGAPDGLGDPVRVPASFGGGVDGDSGGDGLEEGTTGTDGHGVPAVPDASVHGGELGQGATVGGAREAAGELLGGGVEVVASGEPFLAADLAGGPGGGEFIAAGLDRPQPRGGVVGLVPVPGCGDQRGQELRAVLGGEDAVTDFAVGPAGGDVDGAAAVLAGSFDAQVTGRAAGLGPARTSRARTCCR